MQQKIPNRTRARKIILLSLITIVLPLQSTAQTVLDSCLNMPRKGDCLIKQQVAYKDPGTKGVQMLWDISELDPINENYELKYSSLNDEDRKIIGTEHRTMYYYRISGDSLLSLGHESPTTLIKYRRPETLLVFPFPYGRTLTDYFEGTGNYCQRLSIHVQGKSTVTADATGILILPGGDTLQHVMRVYTQKKIIEQATPIMPKDSLPADKIPSIPNCDSIDWHLTHDSVHALIDTWRWYAEGYRYPIFESIRNYIRKYDKVYEHFSTSFYYPPQEQYYGLKDDPDNLLIRERTTEPQKLFGNASQTNENGNTHKDERIQYEYHLNSHGDLLFRYTLLKEADITIALYDLQGRQFTTPQTVSRSTGSYNLTLPLSGSPAGEYLLRISVGDKVYGEKVIK